MPVPNRSISFELTHKNLKFSTPKQVVLFKLAILLHKIYNSKSQSKDWLELSDQIILTRRQTSFNSFTKNNYKIGMNILANKFYLLKNQIKLNDLDLTLNLFKMKMKILLKPYS